jgi:hypothetical protein
VYESSGDACYGPGSIAEAIGSGRQAAASIDRYLRGQDPCLGRLAPDEVLKHFIRPR